MKKESQIPPQKLQTVVRSWVSDPTVNIIPVQMVQSFMASPFFGACNNDWLKITENDFTITPLRSWYESGNYGEKWKDADKVSLEGIKDPMAEYLFKELKEANKNMFARLERPINSQIDPMGRVDPGIIMTSLGNMYDPFINEMTEKKPVFDTVSCGYAMLGECDKTDESEVRGYLNEIVSEYSSTDKEKIDNNRKFVIGGDFSGRTVDTYRMLRELERDFVKGYIKNDDALFNDAVERAKSLMLSSFSALEDAVKFTKVHQYTVLVRDFIYQTSFIANRIGTDNASRFSGSKFDTKITEMFSGFISTITKQLTDEIKKVISTNNPTTTIYNEVLSFEKYRLAEITFDVAARIVVKKVDAYENTVTTTFDDGKLKPFTNTTTNYDDGRSIDDAETYTLFKRKDFILVSAAQYALKTFKDIATDHAIECIANSIDFFVINVATSKFYAVIV
jgi:hypothetical protein